LNPIVFSSFLPVLLPNGCAGEVRKEGGVEFAEKEAMEGDLVVEGAVLEGMLNPEEGTEEDVAEMEGTAAVIEGVVVEAVWRRRLRDGVTGVKELELGKVQARILVQLVKPHES
jgi:hypothetical protein